MFKSGAAFLAVFLVLSPAHANDAAKILAANKAASGNWSGKETLTLSYSYAGQGLDGTSQSKIDVRQGRFVDSYDIAPDTGASGFDGAHAWEKEPSGTVTNQAGGDVLPLAVNEAYRDRNGWWRPGFGGATVTGAGSNTDMSGTFDVLTVTPKGGKSFEAWFDSRTHLLARTVEKQVTLTYTTSYRDYSPVDGAMIAHRLIVTDGTSVADAQTYTLVSARFSKALPASAYARPKAELHDYAIAGGAPSTTVPFRLLNNHIYADVSVDGGAPMPFIFDTGGHDILTPDTARMLHVRSAGATASTGGGDAVVQSGEARVESIRVGDATITDQPVSVLQFSAPGVEGIREAGMVGYEFFARFVMRIDYGRQTLTFFDKRAFDPKTAGTPVPMALYHQFPEVRGSYDGIPARFGIDTGARSPLLLTRPFAEQHKLRDGAAKGVDAMTGWGVGGPTRSFVERGGDLVLGGVTIPHPVTMLSTDKGGAGGSDAFPNNVGGGVLKRFVVTFDYDRGLLYLKRIDAPVADLDTFDRAGAWFNDSPEGFEVIDITHGGPAEASGLKKGDFVTAVDGVPAGRIHLYDLRMRLRDDPPGTVVTLAVKGGGDVKVTLRDQI
ncbi:MAG TPA: aspartyl protease family protein [Rhizomicrobium sp.]|nr:aspartyl protease family protein [Rhizomicrobium sp.]